MTKWYGTYTLTLRAHASRQVRRDEPREDGAPIHEAFTGDVDFSYTTFFTLEFDEKEVGKKKPPTWSEWKGFASATHRSSCETKTRYTCRGKDVDEEKTTWKKTTTKGQADIPTGPNKPKVDDDDSTHQCSEGRVTIDIKKATYDFLLGPPNKSATLTTESREEERSNGEVLRSSVTPPTVGGAVIPMGNSIKKEINLFPLMVGPVEPKLAKAPITIQEALNMYTSSQMGNMGHKLPRDGMVLSGSESVEYQIEKPNAPWQDTKEYEPVTLEASWRFTPFKASMSIEGETEALYNKWLPAPPGRKSEYPDGELLDILVKIVSEDGGQPQKGILVMELKDVSRHKGECTNFPAKAQNEKDDLKFADNQPPDIERIDDTHCRTRTKTSQAKVVVEALDTGAYGIITASCQELGLTAKHDGWPYLPIPADRDNDHIADDWEGRMGVLDLDFQSDDDRQPAKQRRAGDGYTLYEEYRGFMTLDGFKRTDPKYKDLFIYDRDNLVRDNFVVPGNKGKPPNPAELNLHFVDTTMVRYVGDLSVLPEHRWVNVNSRQEESLARQYSLDVKKEPNWQTVPGCGADTAGANIRLDEVPAMQADPAMMARIPDTFAVWLSAQIVMFPNTINALASKRAKPPNQAAFAKQYLQNTLIHEFGHGIGLWHHVDAGGSNVNLLNGSERPSIYQGLPTCAIRYQTDIEEGKPPLLPQLRYCRKGETFLNGFNGLWDPDRPADARIPCHNCFGEIDVKTD